MFPEAFIKTTDPHGSQRLFPQAFKRDLRRSINSKSSMDIKVYFLLFSSAFKRDLRRYMDNKSSMNLLVYFLKLIIDIHEGI